jgi:hypothetical protein
LKDADRTAAIGLAIRIIRIIRIIRRDIGVRGASGSSE